MMLSLLGSLARVHACTRVRIYSHGELLPRGDG